MIGVIAIIRIKEGKGTEFEATAKQLVDKVTANEEGVVYYDLYKQDNTTYVFFEKYKDDKALAIHRKTDYYKAIGAQLGAYMTGAPEITVLKSV